MKIPFITLSFIIMSLLLFSIFIIQHEQAHKSNFEAYGIDSTIEYNYKFWEGESFASTYPERPCPTNECVLVNNLIDGIGYQMLALLIAFLVGVGFIVYSIELLRWDMS